MWEGIEGVGRGLWLGRPVAAGLTGLPPPCPWGLAGGAESSVGGLVDLLSGGNDPAVLDLFHNGAHLAGGHGCKRQTREVGRGQETFAQPPAPRLEPAFSPTATWCPGLSWPLNITLHLSLLSLPLIPHFYPVPLLVSGSESCLQMSCLMLTH